MVGCRKAYRKRRANHNVIVSRQLLGVLIDWLEGRRSGYPETRCQCWDLILPKTSSYHIPEVIDIARQRKSAVPIDINEMSAGIHKGMAVGPKTPFAHRRIAYYYSRVAYRRCFHVVFEISSVRKHSQVTGVPRTWTPEKSTLLAVAHPGPAHNLSEIVDVRCLALRSGEIPQPRCITEIGTLKGGTYSVASAVNTAGDVVGYADTVPGPGLEAVQHAFYWSRKTGHM